ncbi:Glutamate receptor ionotropic like protein [Argiope bruennichi]|uniref:Glutamate receptor ionotropic like protein n=1 Tax=Argiope bruennichi TaxID=94029 RepID=A0A8T0FSP6_ARGBR|nr:Glutamate receptor ionotropic like protein [Argiope bruennichi]
MPLRHVIEIRRDDNGRIKSAGGVEGKLVEMLSSKLGFDYEFILPGDRSWGKLEDGIWNGMIGMVHRNESDIALGDITISEKRMNAVDFLPYAIEDSTFVTRLPKAVLKPAAFLIPFQWPVWLTLFLTVACVLIVFKCIMKKKISRRKLLLSIISSVFAKPFSFHVECMRDRIIVGSWIITTFILSSVYTARLLSSLTVPLSENGVRTIKDLASAVSKGKYKCLTNRGSVNLNLLNESFDGDLSVIKEGMAEVDWFSPDGAIVAPPKIRENVAILGPRWFFTLEYGEPPHTDKYIFKESVSLVNIGMAVNKNFCCKETLRKVISQLLNSGVFKQLYNEEFYKSRWRLLSDRKPIHFGPKALSMSDLLGPFVLLGGGYFLGLLALMFNVIRYKFYR